MPHRPVPVLVLTVCAALVAGCAAGSDEGQAAPATPAVTPSASPAAPASVQCLESGPWVVDNDRKLGVFTEGLRGAATDVTASQTGDAVWVFEDGVLTRTYTAWQRSFSARLNLGGTAALVTETSTLDGSTTAAYEATEADLVTQTADVTGLTVDVVATRDGAPVTFDDPGAAARDSEAQAVSWGFTCDGTTLVVADRSEDGALYEGTATHLVRR